MSAQIPFIDREEELDLIKKAVFARNTRRVIGIQANGGVGKTRLLQEVQHLYQNTTIGQAEKLLVTDILDFDDRANHIPQNVGRRIAQMLGIEEFKPYLRSLLEYQKKQKAENTSYAILQEAEKESNRAFIQCFNQVTRKQRVVLLVDTTEKLETNTAYLFDWIRQSENAVWIMVGRENSSVVQWIHAEQNEEFLFWELQDLSPEASKLYLKSKEESRYITPDRILADKLLILAQGRPILIDLAVEWIARNVPMDWLIASDVTQLVNLSNEEKTQRRENFERQLVWSIGAMRLPMDRLIVAMAHVYPLDTDILSKLLSLSHIDAVSLFQEAQQYVFVKQLPDGRITLHDEMRRMVRAYVWPEIDPDNDRLQEYSKVATSYFMKQEQSLKNKIGKLKLSSESQTEEQVLRNSLKLQTLERELWVVQESLLYHSLIVNLEQGVDVFVRLFKGATDAYALEPRRIFCTLMGSYNFDGIAPKYKYELFSRQIRYLNDAGRFAEAEAIATKMLSDELEKSHRLDLLTLSGRSYELSHNLLEALKQYEEALKMCEQDPELARWKGTVLKNLGRVTREMRRTDRALDYYKQALSIAEEPVDIAAILNSIGYVWAIQGRYRGAFKYCRQALLIYKALKNRDRDVGTTLATIGEVYRNQNHYAQAIDYYYQALPYFERANDLVWLARLYSRRGAVYRLQREYELARRDLRTSLGYNIKEEQPWAAHVLGCVFWNENNWDRAEEMFRQSDELAREVGDIRSQVNNLVGYAELYFDRYRWAEKDPRYLEVVKEKSDELEVLLQQGYGFEHHHGRMKRALADTYFYEDNYDLAFENYKEAYTLLGSRLGGYARLTSFEGEVDWLTARIMELATLGESQLAMAWCQNFREHWGNAELRIMQKDLLLSMCDICEMDVKLRDKGIL